MKLRHSLFWSKHDEDNSMTVRDEATGQEHSFHIGTDAYGIVVRHKGTGHSVCFEVFDGRLQVLVFRAEMTLRPSVQVG